MSDSSRIVIDRSRSSIRSVQPRTSRLSRSSTAEPEPEPSQKRFTIGYALAPKKQQSFMQPSLINLAKERGVDLIKIDTDIELIEQRPFDCVLHKVYGADWKRQVAAFQSKNPSAVIIDSPEATERLHSRISMLQAVSEFRIAKTGSETFGIPNQTVIYDADKLREPNSWETLKFPIIAKPLVADGSAKSHKMWLVYNQTVLTKLNPPIVLQEFINHGGVVFKVYVAGEHVKCVKRKSLPDVSDAELESMGDVLTFSQVSNLGGSSQQTDEIYYKKMKLDDTEMPPESLISYIAKGLREALNLNLFNFDVIRDTSVGNCYLVIDINYFPGYSKMPDYEKVLTEFFCDLAKKEKEVPKEKDVPNEKDVLEIDLRCYEKMEEWTDL